MKKTLKEYYNIEALIFVKISSSQLRVKTDEKDYSLKFVESTDLNTVYAHINMLHLDTFLLPILNSSHQYVTNFEDKFFTLSYWYEDEFTMAKDLRLKYFLNRLADLHHQSVYSIRVNEGFFRETTDFVNRQLDDFNQKLEEYLYAIERSDYRSPAEWLLLLNNQKFYYALNESKKHIEKFNELIKEKSAIRLSLVYQNFDYNHIIVKDNKIISTHRMNFAPPIYDLKYLHDMSYQIPIDLSGLSDDYLQYFKLLDYEIEWLLALIMIPTLDFSGNNEIEKIINITKSLHHLRCSEEIMKNISKFKS